MAIKDQLLKIKENWLLVGIVLVVLLFMSGGNIPLITSKIATSGLGFEKASVSDASYSRSGYGIAPPQPVYGDFAPDVADRKITKSSSLSTEVETGTFNDAVLRLKSIVKSSNSYLLNENVNKYDSGWKSYYSGNYQIKVDTKKYDDVTSQLKGIGEIKSFNENAEDITASHKNLQIELSAEKERLARYNKMYSEAILVADKLQLSDRIFEQERTIQYLEDALKNINQQVDYSTIYVTLNEKQPKYSNIKFVKFSELVERLVASINSLLSLLFIAIPYVIAALVLWMIVRFFRRR